MDTVQMCALELVVVVAAARMRLFINANHQDGKRKKRLAGRRVVTAVGLDRIEVTLAERERESSTNYTHRRGREGDRDDHNNYGDRFVCQLKAINLFCLLLLLLLSSECVRGRTL